MFEKSENSINSQTTGEPASHSTMEVVEAVLEEAGAQKSDGPTPVPDALDQQKTVISKNSPVPAKPLVGSARSIDLAGRLEGTKLGHFKLEEFVGGGGMGAVFRAVDTMLDRTVAVKILSRDSTDEETRRRFQNEGQSAARLDHGNIARVYYVGVDEGLHYIVFEYIEGVNIRDLVEHKGPLPLEEAINYTLQVAEALEHASQRDVVHRDIKPSNVLVTAEGIAKLVDMGLARFHQMESDSQDLTASGVTLGTFDYISPEQARDPRVADVRSDLYSLGCTFYYMLTGRPPFPEGTVLQKLLSHSSDPPSDPRHYRPELDESVVRVMNKMLAKQPRDRFQEPSELIGELLLVADKLDLSNITHGGKVWVSTSRLSTWSLERHLPWLVPVVLLIVGVVAIELSAGKSEPINFNQHRPILTEGPEIPSEAASPVPKESEKADVKGAADAPAESKDNNQETSSSAKTSSVRPAVETPAVKPAAKPATTPASPKSPSSAEATTETVVVKDTDATTKLTPNTTGAPKKIVESPSPKIDVPASSESVNRATPPDDSLEMPTEPTSVMPDVVAEMRPERLIVGPADLSVPDDARLVGSLAMACQEAAALGVSAVELHFNGPREERPFDIAVEELTIRAGSGFRPEVVFRPSIEDFALDRQMIRIGGGNVTWERINVVVELPAEPSDGWALFYLNVVESLNVHDAVLTIRNVNELGGNLHGNVAFFELQAPSRRIESSSGSQPPAFPLPPHVGISHCVVRGQGTLLRAEQATPFRLVGDQCLIVASERLLDVGGVASRPTIQDGRIDLILKHVTAVVGKGMCRLSSREDSPFQLDLVSDCRNSIIYVTDVQAPLIERKGASGIADVEKRLYIRGRDNFYPGSITLLRISPTGGASTAVDYDFDQRDEEWYKEESPRFSLMWNQLPASEVSIDRHTPEDYLLDESDNNPARLTGDESFAGVDVSQLPKVEEATNHSTATVSSESSVDEGK